MIHESTGARLWLVLFLIPLFGAGCSDENILPPTPFQSPLLDCCPSWHPSGNSIIFYHLGVSAISRDGSVHIDPELSGLWVVDTTGTNLRRALNYDVYYPSWSQAGDWLVFEAGYQIFKARVENDTVAVGSIQRLTSTGENFFPTWDPTGEWIAYDSYASGASEGSRNSFGIFIVRSDGTERRLVLWDGRMPNWSPDGKYLVFVSLQNCDVYRVEIAKPSNVTRLTLLNESSLRSDARRPSYSPDGTSIVFEKFENSHRSICMIKSDGSDLRELMGGSEPAFSPDGESIVFLRPSSDPYDNGTVWILKLSEMSLKRVTEKLRG